MEKVLAGWALWFALVSLSALGLAFIAEHVFEAHPAVAIGIAAVAGSSWLCNRFDLTRFL